MDLHDAPRHRYCAYGVAITSDTPLALPEYAHGSLGSVECLSAPASFFRDIADGVPLRSHPDSWYRHASFPDGSTYVQWDGVGEFVVSAGGRRIRCRRDAAASNESFQVYLLGQALSFALVEQRLEPLHATAVLVDGEAVAFLGSNAFGKSTLAASFLDVGCRLITDDLLVLRMSDVDSFAYPGPPRIKLFAQAASRLFPQRSDAGPMNHGTDKIILPLDAGQTCTEPARLRVIYVLAAPRDTCRLDAVSVTRLSPREAFVALVTGTFNRRLVNADRLEHQFGIMATVAERVPLKRLAYGRALERLHDVRRAVFADVQQDRA